jgi:hypothetical protein
MLAYMLLESKVKKQYFGVFSPLKLLTMKILIILFCILPGIAFSQKIFLNKKDPFTNQRTISTDNSKVHIVSGTALLQAGGVRLISPDSADKYILTFITPVLTRIKTATADSVKPFCQIKTTDGSIYSGTWSGDAEVPMMNGKIFAAAGYTISPATAEAISKSQVITVKFSSTYSAAMYELKDKFQSVIPKIFTVLLNAK